MREEEQPRNDINYSAIHSNTTPAKIDAFAESTFTTQSRMNMPFTSKINPKTAAMVAVAETASAAKAADIGTNVGTTNHTIMMPYHYTATYDTNTTFIKTFGHVIIVALRNLKVIKMLLTMKLYVQNARGEVL